MSTSAVIATCHHQDPACARPADYEVRPIQPGAARTRAFCAEHVEAGVADVRRSAETTRVDYTVVALRDDLPDIPFWPSDRRAALKLAIIAALILLVVGGFAVIVPILMRE